ncbi:MAG: flagellin [Lachnospiraceae bacterium]|nr:flagellin [Lachnospiraceae bacterium]
MSMVVQHNMQAANANRMLGVTTSAQSKSTEKLSSGYKINRAADDAAGLSISEKMRKQIRGLDKASSNAQDGVSAVQTAEGALTEVHSMLQRMNELATQAANGTNSDTDRSSIQDEIEQLTTEIDRVSETTKFNETYLLKGNVDGTSSDVKVAAHDAGLAGKLTDNGNGVSTFKIDKELVDGDKVTIAGKEYKIGTLGKTSNGSVLDKDDLNNSTTGYDTAANVGNAVLKIGDSVSYSGKTYTLTDKVASSSVTGTNGNTFQVGDATYTIGAATAGYTLTTADANKKIEEALAAGKQVTATKVGADTNSYTIVSSLEKGEVSKAGLADTKASTVAGAAIGGTATIAANDSVTVGGTTTTAATNAQSAKATYNAITALGAGDTVKIGSGEDAVTYTIVDSTDDEDASTYKLTKDSILSKIQDGAIVDVNGGGAQTVIGDIGSTGSDDSVITAKQAYAKMADELQKASSIGTDTAAKVTNDGKGKFTIQQGTVSVKDSLSFSLHVGADADMTNKITVDVESMSAAGLGIKGLNVNDDNGTAATYAIDSIADAISKVSAQRSALGAVQNRLEHTIDNLDNVSENTSSAESRIRDTDMAKEMVNYSKNNILAQAGQSMLAQANQSNQGVLSLLQ